MTATLASATGTALGIGIVLHATVVGALLVPALVGDFGQWNWWPPTWLARPLRAQSGGLHPRPQVTDCQASGASTQVVKEGGITSW